MWAQSFVTFLLCNVAIVTTSVALEPARESDGGRYLPHHPIRHFAETLLAIDARLEAPLSARAARDVSTLALGDRWGHPIVANGALEEAK